MTGPSPDAIEGAPKPSGLRSVFANLAHLLGGKAAAGLISLVYLVLVARDLGSAGYGVLVLVHGYVTLVGGVVAFSGFHGVVRYGAMALEAGDHPRMVRILRFMTLLELACGAVAVLVAAALAPLVGPRLGWPPEAVQFALPYSLAVLATVRATPQGICQLAGRFDLVGLQQVVPPLTRLVGALVVLALHGGLIGFLIAWLVAALAETVSMWTFGFLALRSLRLAEPLVGPVRGVRQENRGLLGFILTTNLDLTLRDLAPNLIPLTVGWMLGPAATGLFSLAQRATAVLHQPAVLLSQASYSVFARLASAHDWAGLGRTAWRSAGLSILIALPILLALGLFGQQVMGLLGGKGFVAGGPLLFLLALARTVALGSALLIAALTAMGRPARSISVNLCANVGLYPLLPALLLLVGLDGAGWHAVLQNLLSAGLLAWLFGRALRQQSPPLPQGEGDRAV